ncbi:hypothetical protein [Roseisolibacter agri]|uniref:Uncharacterized protein n=1 Tax=Roseisolibacter agri TaxID=2014610 RepID=A0AA37V637_9BACT|nr:hypothetical protein [Roseisolibacter agri]GLC24821.1 hypothetical protein rosag_13340 [Roseisolibacter agri]
MTTLYRPDGTLVVRAHDVAWLWIAGALLVGAVLLLSLPLAPPMKGSPILGAGAMTLVAVAALAAYEDRVAEFRTAEQRVHWSRRTLFRREQGTLRYEGITAVELVERRGRTATYGLVLHTGGRRFALHGSTTSRRARYEAAGGAVAAALSDDAREVPFLG